jgi:hypothetical protein
MQMPPALAVLTIAVPLAITILAVLTVLKLTHPRPMEVSRPAVRRTAVRLCPACQARHPLGSACAAELDGPTSLLATGDRYRDGT